MLTHSYFYLSRHLAKSTMSNSRGPVRTKKTSTQIMSNYKMGMQKIPNLHICYTYKSESKRVHVRKCVRI